ncbi:MAG: hypothetical protein Fur0011_1320 [Candidatus Microgenomates bacterium]
MSDSKKHTFNISFAATELVPNKVNRNMYLTTIVLALVLLGVAAFFYGKLPDKIPVLLTAPWGEGRLASRIFVYGGGLLVLAVTLLNITLGKLWGGGGSLIPRILSITAVVFALAMSVSLWGMLQSFFL